MPVVIQCPFFKKENGLKTHCEGGVVIHPDREARKDFIFGLCASEYCWNQCSIAKSLNRYYERIDN